MQNQSTGLPVCQFTGRGKYKRRLQGINAGSRPVGQSAGLPVGKIQDNSIDQSTNLPIDQLRCGMKDINMVFSY